MQAIKTKYLGPTNTRGARIKAECYSGSLTQPFAYELCEEDRHIKAALALAEKLEWTDKDTVLITGQLKDGSYVHVFEPRN